MQKQAHSRACSAQGPSRPCCLASRPLSCGCRVAVTPDIVSPPGRKPAGPKTESVPGTYCRPEVPRPLPCSCVTRPVT